MLKNEIRKLLQVHPLINPFIYEDINRMGAFCGINNETKREHQIIVTLTAQREYFKELQITIFSILNQSLKPDRIILWLDEETESLATLPYEITRFIKNGLEIRFAKDVKNYTGSVYAFKEFKDSIIVTANNNIYYRKDWLKRLYLSYITNPDDIHVHCAQRVLLTNGATVVLREGTIYVSQESAEYNNFLLGDGGVLYPPGCFSKEALRDDIFTKYAPDYDDIWFWIRGVIQNKKIRVVKNHYSTLIAVNIFKKLFDKSYENNFDLQFKSLMDLYGQNILNKLKQHNTPNI